MKIQYFMNFANTDSCKTRSSMEFVQNTPTEVLNSVKYSVTMHKGQVVMYIYIYYGANMRFGLIGNITATDVPANARRNKT